MPPSLQDWLPEKHLARFLSEVCEQLDVERILASYETGDGRGLAANGGWLQTYNAQAAVDQQAQAIVAAEVTEPGLSAAQFSHEPRFGKLKIAFDRARGNV